MKLKVNWIFRLLVLNKCTASVTFGVGYFGHFLSWFCWVLGFYQVWVYRECIELFNCFGSFIAKSISVNVDVGMIDPNSGCTLLLGVLVIAGDPLGVVRLLKGDGNGPNPVIRLYLSVVDTGVDVPVTGVCDAGGLLPSSALSYCSSPDVKVSVLGSGSESELSAGAHSVQQSDSLRAAVISFSFSSSIDCLSTTVLVVETKWVTTMFAALKATQSMSGTISHALWATGVSVFAFFITKACSSLPFSLQRPVVVRFLDYKSTNSSGPKSVRNSSQRQNDATGNRNQSRPIQISRDCNRTALDQS
ncbi:uncharacterized protein LACBIDRAFT_331956 [Laccaria bicolor S238N-H82]|uniref:Predicted protein n=1 Tax=Laccaria bicolor (strain S238N-H82 / ATCC MYA-4686) TaxID=486041 RepID=B0DR57_LACBS|nr:uncharacterized protein LACBIDRAFT_331956 [Laccaria bicolor S238N-H82]EDR03005.1 predicted protein [Laccaria bicolor S238N-H82]|eukprot:XP_001886428.1 predicted protein [Laccaria bicolor S238N-H82]